MACFCQALQGKQLRQALPPTLSTVKQSCQEGELSANFEYDPLQSRSWRSQDVRRFPNLQRGAVHLARGCARCHKQGPGSFRR